MDGSDYEFIELLDRIYLNGLCCPMPTFWAELGKHISSAQSFSNAEGICLNKT